MCGKIHGLLHVPMCKARKVFAWICGAAYGALMKYVGVDGCKAGWLAVVLDDRDVSWTVCPEFVDVADQFADACCLFVDMPIGLPASGTREADRLARESLPRHLKGSIFNTPVRSAVHAPDKATAKQINKALTGKSLSEQSLGIIKKILDVDLVLQQGHAIRENLFEAHPEVCFQRFAGRNLDYSKKDILGSLERIEILEKISMVPKSLLEDVRKQYTRSNVAGDDVLDACVLAAAAWRSKGKPACFPLEKDGPPRDETGLPMAIWYPK